MKREKADKPLRAVLYARVGSIQQAFRSNAELARHFFKELLEDGKEHSYREVRDYVLDKTDGRGVDGERMTDETIHSAIWYMFRHERDTDYLQTHKGYYQKTTAELLLGDSPHSLKEFALRSLAEARERIDGYADASGLSGDERQKLAPIRDAINFIMGNTMRQISEYDSAQAMTAENLDIDDELIIDEDHVNAYLGMWFDADKRFGLQTEGTDAYINLYADYYPENGSLNVYYILHDSDGAGREPVPVSDLTDFERETILRLMRDAGLEERVTEMQDSPDEDTGMTMT
jgi:hypothetical protein